MANNPEDQLGVPEREQPPVEEPVVEETPSERPEGLPDNFDSIGALAKSYEESRAEMARAQQRAAAAESAAAELSQRMEAIESQAQWNQPQQANNFVQEYQDALDQGDAQALLRLNAQMVQAATQMQMQQYQPQQQTVAPELAAAVINQEMRRRVGDDWDQGLGQRVAEYAQQNHWMIPPDLNPQDTIERLTEIARIVGGPEPATGQQDAQLAQAKRQAQGLHGGNGFVQGAKSPEDVWIARLKEVGSGY